MRTDELIKALSVDRLSARTPIDRTLGMALLSGSAISAIVFALLLGARADAAESVSEWRFLMKFVVTLGVTLPAALLLFRLARPVEDSTTPWWLLLMSPAVLIVCVASELMMVPASSWSRRLIGSNAIHCVTLIPMLSLAPLLWLFAALKRGAPANPRLAGAIGGLVSAGIGAALYALNCPDDSPLFVATWYVIAIGAVTMIGSIVGARLLRW